MDDKKWFLIHLILIGDFYIIEFFILYYSKKSEYNYRKIIQNINKLKDDYYQFLYILLIAINTNNIYICFYPYIFYSYN